MKKILVILLISAVAVFAFGCGGGEGTAEEETVKLVVVSTPVPHAEILSLLSPFLKNKVSNYKFKSSLIMFSPIWH